MCGMNAIPNGNQDTVCMSSDDQLIVRRGASLGPMYRHFYEKPLHLVRGEGVWLWDAEGNQYLDCYNNVASVGHCHPRVVEAICRQVQRLNTHTRYLHENVVLLAERLGSLLPGDLGTCIFSCTGTEANDLAVQIARAVTGRQGIIVTEASYFGNSTLIRKLSTGSYPTCDRPDWLAVVEPPDYFRGPFRQGEPLATAGYLDSFEQAVRKLEQSGYGLAAVLVDMIWDAPGPLTPPVEYVQGICETVRSAGGLVIADEIQAGHCRTGRWWGIEHYDLQPDIVTLGKPSGNGHPLGATVVTPDIAAAFSSRQHYFNTFGGNPVSAIAGLTVLEVMEEEHLARNAKTTGAYLRTGLEKLRESLPIIGNVQGRGLFLGLDLVEDSVKRTPLSPDVMRNLMDRLMREEGVLVGITGRYGNVLKLRPPLVFGPDHADRVISAIGNVLRT